MTRLSCKLSKNIKTVNNKLSMEKMKSYKIGPWKKGKKGGNTPYKIKKVTIRSLELEKKRRGKERG